jgi:hypothetical protein
MVHGIKTEVDMTYSDIRTLPTDLSFTRTPSEQVRTEGRTVVRIRKNILRERIGFRSAVRDDEESSVRTVSIPRTHDLSNPLTYSRASRASVVLEGHRERHRA